MLEGLGRSEDALVHFLVLVEERGSARDHHMVGVTLYGLGRYDEAIVHLERACVLGNDPMDLELCAMCAERMRTSRPPGVLSRLARLLSSLAGTGKTST